MKDSDWVMYTFNMLELQKKEKEDAKKKKQFEEHNDDRSRKDQEGSSKNTLSNKQKQKSIHGGCKMQIGQIKWNQRSSSKPPMKEGKDADNHVQRRTLENIILNSNIIDLTIKKTYKEVIQNERLEEKNESKKKKDQDDSFGEGIPQNQQQQQKEHDINGETELNIVTCEDRFTDNSDLILNDSTANYGSKLWTRDEKNENYRIMQGIPRSIKFRSITNLYKCTNRISLVEDEYNWNLSTEEDSNMNLSTKEDLSIITNKENVGCKRKWRENQKANGEADATTSST